MRRLWTGDWCEIEINNSSEIRGLIETARPEAWIDTSSQLDTVICITWPSSSLLTRSSSSQPLRCCTEQSEPRRDLALSAL
jgi:hypothetical protein